MSAQLTERIQQLDDYTAIRLVEQFAGRVFEGMETPMDEMVNGVIPEVKNTAFFQQALSLSEAEQSQPLSEQQSAEIARTLLITFAQDPALAPVLAQTLDEYKDDRLMVGAILAVGVAVSMIIVATTTRLEGKIGSMHFTKEVARPDDIKAVSGLLQNVLPSLGGISQSG